MDEPKHPARLAAALHAREVERLAALDAYGILDTPREPDFDDIAALASEICGTPIAVVNLVGDGRQWFKAEVGLGVRETPLETSFCGHALLEADFLQIPDATKDPRFDCNPLVTAEAGIRFYAGALLKVEEGLSVGTLCVLDTRPRELTDQQARALRRLARQVMAQLELRRALRMRDEGEARLRALNADLERERAAEVRRYREIVEATAGAICAFDTEYRLIAFNKAHNDEFRRVNGFDTKIGDVFPDLFVPEQQASIRALMRRALCGESFTVREAFGRPELGKPVWEVCYTPLRDETGRVIGAFHHALDVSERLVADAELKAAQEALRQSQKLEAVGQLTGGVAHDFNNLLTIIRSSTDLLRKPGLAEDRRRRYIDAIADTVERASKLTGQLLAFARRQALKPEVFDVGGRVRAVTSMLDTLAGSRVQIRTEVPDEPLFMKADVSQFETALINMAVNARDAMDGEGLLTIRVWGADAIPSIRGHAGGPGRFVAVSLTDTGSGIPEERLADIFEPFFTTKEVGKGTGLGLSQVFGFAKQSGGDVAVASEAGRGTTFTLYLPRTDAPQQVVSEGDERRSAAPEDGRGRRLLVVEDNVEVGTFATQLLQDLGYTTTWAANAVEALALLDDGQSFDAVFSDVVMPGMSGVELGNEIRIRFPDVPVVLTSGYSHLLAEEGRHGFELVKKPYAVEELSRVLRRATSRGRRQLAQPDEGRAR